MARLVALLIVLVPVLAFAQAPGSDAPPPDGAGSAAGSDVTPPVSAHDTCLARRHEIEAAANHAADLDTRTKLLQSLPDCSKPDAALPPPPPTCGEGQQLLDGQCVGGREEHRGATAEISAGVTFISINSSGGGYSIAHGAAVNFGVGKFVTHDVAMSLRASGTFLDDGGTGWIGVIGPHVQGWFGDGFIGGGLGLGVAIGCGDSCDATTTSGFDLRAGYRVSPSATLSFELESLSGFFSAGALTMASALIGFQSF